MLEIEDVAVAYGAIRAVQGVSLRVEESEIVALLGPNGAGKTSLLSAIVGLVPVAEGRIAFNGHDVTRATPEQMVRRGLTLTPEGRRIFGSLTVEENLRLGGAVRADHAALAADRRAALDLFPALESRLQLSAGKLSGGEQQMLAIARSLMSGPKLLMLDEPSLGLSPLIVEEIFELFGALQARGITILLVEQNAQRALEVANRVYVISSGRLEFTGTPAEFATADDLMQAYVGAGVAD